MVVEIDIFVFQTVIECNMGVIYSHCFNDFTLPIFVIKHLYIYYNYLPIIFY